MVDIILILLHAHGHAHAHTVEGRPVAMFQETKVRMVTGSWTYFNLLLGQKFKSKLLPVLEKMASSLPSGLY